MKRIILLCLLFQAAVAAAQVEVRLIIESGTSSSTCNDLFGAPDFFWEANVEGEGWTAYPQSGNCYTALPNQQYTASYTCFADVPASIEVCFRAYENDAPGFEIGINCDIDRTCEESICQDFTLPAPGTSSNHSLALPAGLSSSGEVSFRLEVLGNAGANDLPCDAISLGALTREDTLGDFTQGIYDNLCGTNANEPNPATQGGFSNENGVWFQFTTPADVGSLLFVRALNDPQATGDEFDIQLAVYSSDDNSCSGNLNLESWTSPNDSYDATLQFRCPQPNTTYFVLVDGAFSATGSEEGLFGLDVISIDVDDAPDERCDALMLGEVPEGGSVGLDAPVANFCAASVNDPFSPEFVVQSSVWFRFIAPPSGHVIVEATSDRTVDSIGLQLSAYLAQNDDCTRFFLRIASAYTFQDLDETMELTCLYPGRPYYILVDGDGTHNRGIFDVRVTDAGDITPVTQVDTTICSGESFSVGTSVYTEPGTYSDTLQVFQGCDSIVNTTLSVLEPIVISLNQLQPAIGEGNANGIAEVTLSGGTGNYMVEWCDGTQGLSSSSLVGGAECCVMVTDDFGCMADTCFFVEFVTDIIPSYTGDTLDCFGDDDGEILFSAINGQPPYTYNWQNDNNSINGSGMINVEGEEVTLPGLPAGQYFISIMDAFFDTTFTVNVLQPERLEFATMDALDASCFGVCDGNAMVSAAGGVGGYQFAWSNGASGENIESLCAGQYTVSLTDANGCEAITSLTIGQPEEFIVTAREIQPVSCFEGSDGIAGVETNGNPIAYAWSNGAATPVIEGLAAGTYTVEVTNADGCLASGEVSITQPSGPVEVEIVQEQAVSCKGDTDAALRAVPSGPGQSFGFEWFSGASGEVASGLGAGDYSVRISNEKGCEANAEFTITEPDEIQAQLSATNVTCISGENGGAVSVDAVSGGTPPYEFSLDGILFSDGRNFPSLFAGSYTVTVRDAAGCEASFDQVVEGAPELQVNLGEDRLIPLGDSIRLSAQANSQNVAFTWTLPDSTAKLTSMNIWVAPKMTSTYLVEAVDTVTFCRDADFVIVAVQTKRRGYVPPAFSPNEDGNNDFFTVYGDNAIAMVKTFRIFSRTGNMVFEKKDFLPNDESQGWDGTFRGEELDPGVFVYMAEIEFVDGKEEVYSGDVMLMR